MTSAAETLWRMNIFSASVSLAYNIGVTAAWRASNIGANGTRNGSMALYQYRALAQMIVDLNLDNINALCAHQNNNRRAGDNQHRSVAAK